MLQWTVIAKPKFVALGQLIPFRQLMDKEGQPLGKLLYFWLKFYPS